MAGRIPEELYNLPAKGGNAGWWSGQSHEPVTEPSSVVGVPKAEKVVKPGKLSVQEEMEALGIRENLIDLPSEEQQKMVDLVVAARKARAAIVKG